MPDDNELYLHSGHITVKGYEGYLKIRMLRIYWVLNILTIEQLTRMRDDIFGILKI